MNISVNIVFDDQDNADLNRPESVTVYLYANGAEMDSAIITADDGWTHTFNELPKYLDGHPINYSITEDPVEWYVSNTNGFTIINTYAPETTSADVVKIWDDNNNALGMRPSSIAMTLSNGQTVVLSEANNWTAVINDLPTHINKELVSYTWTEQTVPNYTQKNVSQQNNTTTFTNAPDANPDLPPEGPNPK